MAAKPKNNDTTEAGLVQSVSLPLSKLEANKGQIEGLPANPRLIRDEKFKLLVKSIKDNPEMLSLRESLVYAVGKKHVVIGGNMRLAAMRDLGYKQAPVKVIPGGATTEELKAYIIKDNNGFGEWDMDMLANEWDEDLLKDWGVDLPSVYPEDGDGGEKHSKSGNKVELKFKLSVIESGFVCQELARIDANKEVALLKLLGYEKDNVQ